MRAGKAIVAAAAILAVGAVSTAAIFTLAPRSLFAQNSDRRLSQIGRLG